MVKKLLIFFSLLLLVISSFLIRLDVFKKSTNISIDEVVYYRMGKQVMRDWTDYNTIPYAHYLQSEGRELPEYFFQPLYKHPPLFTFLIAAFMKLFGKSPVSGGYVSLGMGVLMIPLTYLLATLFFNRIVGLMAAFFVYIDPVSIITSQKAWPDTTLAFFMVLSVYLFAYAIKSKNDLFFLYCGIALGLAMLTKYTGALSLLVIVLYTIFYARELFIRKIFYVGIFFVPPLILSPWFLWNGLVYGIAAVSRHAELNAILKGIFPQLGVVFLVIGGILLYLKKKKGSLLITKINNELSSADRINRIFTPGMLVILALLLHKEIAHSLQFDYIPFCTWRGGSFVYASSYFYFGRLLEFSFIYAFSFVALFSFHPNEEKGEAVVRIAAFVILIFFIAWRNFQSRYILASIPFLVILGIDAWVKFYNYFSVLTNRKGSVAGRLILIALLVFIILRTYNLNSALSYTNDMCYY